MARYIVNTNRSPVDIAMIIRSNSNNRMLKTIVYNPETQDVILERIDLPQNFVNGQREVVLKMPITPDKVVIETFGENTGRRNAYKDESFEVFNIRPMRLRTYDIDYGSGDREFLAFIEKFVQDLPRIQPSDRIIQSPSGTFKIVLWDRLKSRSGEYINSPAMVGIKSGIIEVSKEHFMKMSWNQRMATLSHEYAHFYKNPLAGYDVRSEYGADLHGLTVYLAKGYGESEYINAFRKTFNGHPTQQNRARWKLIEDFSTKIHNGQFFGKPYNL